MKCIVLLSFVALCYSYPYGSGYWSGSWLGSGLGSGLGTGLGSGKYYNINQDGSITVTTGTGKIINISKTIDQSNAVTVAGPGLTGYYYGTQPTQGDILAQILAQYQGNVSPKVYQQLLGDINSAVQSGQISNSIYQALQNLNQVGPYQGYSQVVSGPIQGKPLGVLGGLYGQIGQQGYPLYVSIQQQYPYGQVVETVEEGIVPIGVSQQGQIIPKSLPVVPYPISQGMLGQQGFGGISMVGGSKTAYQALINSILSGNLPQQSAIQYGQQVEPIGSQLNQIVQGESAILNKQNQVQQLQLQQQLQQQQLLQQQFQEQQQQQQLQNQQQYVQGLQQKEQQEQIQVLLQQQQQQQNGILNYLLNQQTDSYQPQSGLYGVYGQGFQGIQQYNIPLVV